MGKNISKHTFGRDKRNVKYIIFLNGGGNNRNIRNQKLQVKLVSPEGWGADKD